MEAGCVNTTAHVQPTHAVHIGRLAPRETWSAWVQRCETEQLTISDLRAALQQARKRVTPPGESETCSVEDLDGLAPGCDRADARPRTAPARGTPPDEGGAFQQLRRQHVEGADQVVFDLKLRSPLLLRRLDLLRPAPAGEHSLPDRVTFYHHACLHRDGVRLPQGEKCQT